MWCLANVIYRTNPCLHNASAHHTWHDRTYISTYICMYTQTYTHNSHLSPTVYQRKLETTVTERARMRYCTFSGKRPNATLISNVQYILSTQKKRENLSISNCLIKLENGHKFSIVCVLYICLLCILFKNQTQAEWMIHRWFLYESFLLWDLQSNHFLSFRCDCSWSINVANRIRLMAKFSKHWYECTHWNGY